MRSRRYNGMIVAPGEHPSSFLSCEKDMEKIIEKLFVEEPYYSTLLKALLVVNTKDILLPSDGIGEINRNPAYIEKISQMTPKKLHDEGYIRTAPKIKFGENEEVKSYLLFTFDNFAPSATNKHYRDCTVMIDVICHIDHWDLGNYRIRPLKIAGVIDSILNGNRLSGIGTFDLLSCNEIVLTEELAGYCLIFSATHGNDDLIPEVEEDEEE